MHEEMSFSKILKNNIIRGLIARFSLEKVKNQQMRQFYI